jgi:hypothetical protein
VLGNAPCGDGDRTSFALGTITDCLLRSIIANISAIASAGETITILCGKDAGFPCGNLAYGDVRSHFHRYVEMGFIMLIGVRKASSYLKIILESNKFYVLGFVASTQPTRATRAAIALPFLERSPATMTFVSITIWGIGMV